MNRFELRRLVHRVLIEGSHVDPEKTYRCFGGEIVQFGSPECLTDIQMRMDDAAATRDGCDGRTDKRVVYNGILQMLRRELREAERANRVLYSSDMEEI